MSPCWTLLLLALLHCSVIDASALASNRARDRRSSSQQSGSSSNLLDDLPYQSEQLTGVAYLNGFVYATSKRSSAIIVYDGSTLSFSRVDDIVVDGLKAANDLAVDPDRQLLFVADQSMRIWKVDVSTSSPTSTQLLETSFSPAALWFNQKTNQLVIIAEGSSQVYTYSVDSGNIQTAVTLPRDLSPKHAVATDYGTFLVAHTARSLSDSLHDNVTEFTARGEVVRSFGGRRGGAADQLNTPRHLALKADGSLLVADWINGRITKLDSLLHYAGFVVEGVPVTRLCLVEQRGLLIAGLTKQVAIYKP